MSNEPQDIYLRAHSVPTERKEDDKRKRQNVEPKGLTMPSFLTVKAALQRT